SMPPVGYRRDVHSGCPLRGGSSHRVKPSFDIGCTSADHGVRVAIICSGGALAWAVIAPTAGPLRGGLAGTYVGASGEIGVGVGVGANVLLGGSGRSVALQPLSLEGSVSLNLALGVAGLTL